MIEERAVRGPVQPAGVTSATRPVRVRFVGVEGGFNSVATHGHRVSRGINQLGIPGIVAETVLVPRSTFASHIPFWLSQQKAWAELTEDTDIIVLVKSSTFDRFHQAARAFKAFCAKRNVILASSPADGPGANAGDVSDTFSEDVADCVFTASNAQYEYLCRHRDHSTVFNSGVATRPLMDAAVTIRDRVQTVVWENPTHHDPNFNPSRVAFSRDEYAAFENTIRDFCEQRGASLLTFGYWRDSQDDEEWQTTLLSADIAIECKALGRRYTNYQLQKPATKLQNYLALGLPVVCDSVPSYVEVGKHGGVLFADSIDEWTDRLGRLFDSRQLRAELSAASRRAVASHSIAAVAADHVACFKKMLGRSTAAGHRELARQL